MKRTLILIFSLFSISLFSSYFNLDSIGTWEAAEGSYTDEESGDVYSTLVTLKITIEANCSVLIEEYVNGEPQFGRYEKCEIKGNFLWARHESGRGGRQVLFKGYLNTNEDASLLMVTYKDRAHNSRWTHIKTFKRAR